MEVGSRVVKLKEADSDPSVVDGCSMLSEGFAGGLNKERVLEDGEAESLG